MAARRRHLAAGYRLGNAVRARVRIERADPPATFSLPQPVYVPELVLWPPGKPVVHHLPGDFPITAEVMASRGGHRLGRQEGGGRRRCVGPGRRSPGACRRAGDGDSRRRERRGAQSDGESDFGRTVQRSRAIQGELSAGHVIRVLNCHPLLPGRDRFSPAGSLVRRMAKAVACWRRRGFRATARLRYVTRHARGVLYKATMPEVRWFDRLNRQENPMK